MKGYLCLGLLLISTGVIANQSDCSDAVGLWMGKFSYTNPDYCEQKSPELCSKVSIAIGLRQLPSEPNQFVADLYPQRGVAASVPLQCENGRLLVSGRMSRGIKIKYQCDEADNCVVTYEDMRLKSQLIKLWQEDSRI